MRDYTQKTVYIGIDVHKKSYSVAVICEGIVVKRDTMTAYPAGLVKYIRKYFAGAKVNTVYEAGFSGYCLHRHLLSKDINNIVAHPASIKVSSRDRVKTDKRDALKMAKQLSNGDLKGITVPSEKRENLRSITRLRDSVLKTRRRVGNQLKSLLHLHGLIESNDDTKVGKMWIKKLSELEVTENIKYCIDMYSRMWLELSDKLKEILKRLHAQAKEDEVIDKYYRSVPGIGALSARILANELEDTLHFSSEKSLFSYTGLTPSEHSSGEHRRQGNISRQGKPVLRKVLVLAAWRAIGQDARLNEIFERISKCSGRKRAIVAIARKLIGCIRSCFKTGELWNADLIKKA